MIDKKAIHDLMMALGIRSQNRVWAFIKGEERTQSEVIEFIHALKEEQDDQDNRPVIALNDLPIGYPVYGRTLIESTALGDMSAIARLPYVKAAAQMPDSHRVKEGHVPVGGVVVTDDCVLPGVVGNDIACSVGGLYTNEPVSKFWFNAYEGALKHIMEQETYFGIEYNPHDLALYPEYTQVLDYAHNIMDELKFDESKKLLQHLMPVLRKDFGTSGEGNHFIELGYSNVKPVRSGTRGNTLLVHDPMTYNFAILTHFGSRGVGSAIANFYLKKANELNPVPKGMEDNAPLFFGVDGWAEDYWLMMELAGVFAQNGHKWIQDHIMERLDHENLLDSSGLKCRIITTHNYAWTEEIGFVHRKGATPAHAGHYANIPATMGDQSRIVVGIGKSDYLNSASHGAGRKMSRSQALKQGWEDVGTYVAREFGVTLIGGGSDEDPRAYKKIEEVMRYQYASVMEIGRFTPFICRMAAPHKAWGKKKTS